MKLWELIALLQAFQDKNAEVCVVLETSKDHHACCSTIDFDISDPTWRKPRILVNPSGEGQDYDRGTVDTIDLELGTAMVRWDTLVTTPAPLEILLPLRE